MVQTNIRAEITAPIATETVMPEFNQTVRRLVKEACEQGTRYRYLEEQAFMAAQMGDISAFDGRGLVSCYWMRRSALAKYVYSVFHEKRRGGVAIGLLLSELRLAVLQGHRDYLNAIRPFDPDATQEIPVPEFWRAT